MCFVYQLSLNVKFQKRSDLMMRFFQPKLQFVRYLRYRVSIHWTGGDSVHGYSVTRLPVRLITGAVAGLVWEYYSLQASLYGLSVNISHGNKIHSPHPATLPTPTAIKLINY